MSRSKSSSLGVDWFLPGRKRRFGTTTQATNDLIVLMADEGHTVQTAYDGIRYDPEAKAILSMFIIAKYGETKLSELVR